VQHHMQQFTTTCTHHTYLAHTDVIWDVQLLICPQQHLQHLQCNVGYSLQQNNVVTVSQLHMLYNAASAQLSLLHHEMHGEQPWSCYHCNMGAMLPWQYGATLPWQYGATLPWQYGAILPEFMRT